jgi:threonine/homoserine/homoserine lactone efflux protein
MTSQLVTAVLALAVLTVLPGPDVAVVTRAVLTAGRAASAKATLGIATGLLVWGLLTVAGLAAVLAASATAYTVVKLVGAAYLVWLGVQAFLAARRSPTTPEAAPPRAMRQPFRVGLFSNLLNPKIAVFYTGLLPQLVPVGAPRVAGMLGLVTVHVVLSIGWLLSYGLLVHGASGVLQRPRVRRVLDRVTGTVLIGFGIRVAVAHRP